MAPGIEQGLAEAAVALLWKLYKSCQRELN